MVPEAINIIQGNRDIKLFGELLNQTWETKRSLSNKLSNDEIDRIYTLALSAGAIGGKLLGAGGGGNLCFFLLNHQSKRQLEELLKTIFLFHLNSKIMAVKLFNMSLNF